VVLNDERRFFSYMMSKEELARRGFKNFPRLLANQIILEIRNGQGVHCPSFPLEWKYILNLAPAAVHADSNRGRINTGDHTLGAATMHYHPHDTNGDRNHKDHRQPLVKANTEAPPARLSRRWGASRRRSARRRLPPHE